jgi:hypothetical protein
MPAAAVTVRRHWGAFRTPWVIRKLRKSPDTRARLPEAYAYTGSRAGADEWTRALVAETESFRHPPTGPAVAEPRRAHDGFDPTDLLDAPGAVHHAGDGGGNPTGGGGQATGGGGGDWLSGAGELGLIIIAAIAVLIIAVPLGLIGLELVLTLGLAVAGAVLRLAHIKPWTVLVSRDRNVVAVIAVKGWRTSRAVIASLRRQA